MAVYVECPSRPPRTLYDEHVTVHGPGYEKVYLPVDPEQSASRKARERYAKDLAAHAELLRLQKSEIMPPRPGPVFLCGDKIDQEPFCACGHTAEMLCDYPMGHGLTCDLPVCWCCSRFKVQGTSTKIATCASSTSPSSSERHGWNESTRGRPRESDTIARWYPSCPRTRQTSPKCYGQGSATTTTIVALGASAFRILPAAP